MRNRTSGNASIPEISRRITKFLAFISVNGILVLFSASCIFPVIWMMYSTLKTNREFGENVIALPKRINFENYLHIIKNGNIMANMFNSTRTTAVSLFFIVLFGFIIGYFLARFKFAGRNAIRMLLLFGMLIPIHAVIVPEYILFRQLGISDQWFTLMFPYISFGLPISVFLSESYIKNIPREMEEAASIDGSGFARTLFTIIMPMSMPVLATIGIIQFFACWNEFIFGLILVNDESLLTLPVALARFKGQYSADYPKMMTTMVISMLPAMVIYFSFSSRIIRGMVAGAVKG